MLSPLSKNISPLSSSRARYSSYYDYVATLSPYLDYRLDEASGNLIDHGSFGINAVVTLGGNSATTYHQTGQLGANEAIISTPPLGNNTTVFTTPYNAGLGAVTSFEIIMLLKRTSTTINGALQGARLFGGSQGATFSWGSTDASVGPLVVFTRNTIGGTFTTTTLTTAAKNVWYMLRFRFNDAGDRTPHIWINGTEASYSGTPQALTGTFQAPSTVGWTWLNNNARNSPLYGLVDDIKMFPLMTDMQWITLVSLTGV